MPRSAAVENIDIYFKMRRNCTKFSKAVFLTSVILLAISSCGEKSGNEDVSKVNSSHFAKNFEQIDAIFRMDEAMTWHTGELDLHHLGRFEGLESRHNVHHWGCGAKEVRISQAALT